MTVTWQPLLAAERRDAALATARSIAAALADPPDCVVLEGSSESARVMNVSLGIGRAGVALTLGYLSLCDRDEPSYAASARRLIGEAVRATSTEPMSPSFYSGFTGISWALGKLSAWDIVRIDDRSLSAVDAMLASYLDRENWPYPVDAVAGLTGHLVYALSRLPRPDAVRCVERGVRALESCARETPEGIAWFIPPTHMWGMTLEKAPRGCYNLGVAHGTPGTIAVLSEAVAAGIEETRARRLVEGAVTWLLAHEIGDSGNFPVMAGPDVEPKAARLSWCYGAPGIPLVLLRAARALGRTEWRDEAVRIALAATERPLETTGVIDAPFCHGAAGLAHMFNRLHQETGEPRFADAARDWLDRALAFREEGEGVAGFSARPLPDGRKYPEPGLVYGAAGVAATLMAAASDVPPIWDAAFLISDSGAAA